MKVEINNKANVKVSIEVNELGVTVVTIDQKPAEDLIKQSWERLRDPNSNESKIMHRTFKSVRRG